MFSERLNEHKNKHVRQNDSDRIVIMVVFGVSLLIQPLQKCEHSLLLLSILIALRNANVWIYWTNTKTTKLFVMSEFHELNRIPIPFPLIQSDIFPVHYKVLDILHRIQFCNPNQAYPSCKLFDFCYWSCHNCKLKNIDVILHLSNIPCSNRNDSIYPVPFV